jgi:hypothetical protein
MAVGILGVLTLTGVTLVYYSSTNHRSARFSTENASAYDLAEAGINEMMAVLSKPQNNALNKHLLGWQDGGTVQKTVHEYDVGTVTWWGTLDEPTATWSLTSVGTIKNPTGAAGAVARTLTAKVPVTPTVTQPLNNPSWNYVMSTATGDPNCDMTVGSTVEIRTNLYVFGHLCLQQQAKVLDGTVNDIVVVVNGKLTQYTQNNTVGTSAAPISEVRIAQGCKWFTNAMANPCITGASTSVYATTLHTTPATLVAPTADWQAWYLNASPGPYYPCSVVNTGVPPTFDNDQGSPTSPDPSKRNSSVTSAFNLTGAASYSCKTASGELSWDAVAKTLTVSGTIFVDGDLKVESSTPTTVLYNGQATIYLSGSLKIKNTNLCGAIVSNACAFDTWDPNTRMLTFVANGDNRQPEVPQGVSVKMLNSSFQGALFATNKLDIDSFSKVDGPMVASEVVLGQSVSTNDFPNITTVPAGMPGNPTVYAQPNPPQLYSG